MKETMYLLFELDTVSGARSYEGTFNTKERAIEHAKYIHLRKPSIDLFIIEDGAAKIREDIAF